VTGLFGGAAGIACMGLAPTGLYFTLAMLPNALWGLAMPTLQALMTQRVSESEQGQLQGAGTSMNSVAGLLAPGLFTVTFAHFIGRTPDHPDVPGSAFLLAALVLLAAMAAAWFATRPRLSADRLV